jgi:D-glucuronyl C5-epimerase C-terminus
MVTASRAYAWVYQKFPLSWRMKRTYRLPSDGWQQPYYIEWDPRPRPRGEGWRTAVLDHDGVLVTSQGHNPVSIAQYALHLYKRLLDGDEVAHSQFLGQARYFLTRQREDGAYPYQFPCPAYGLQAGWVSGMAQGEAASVLFRLYRLTARKEHLEAALRALEPLKRDVSLGGAASIEGNHVFFEEYPSNPPSHVLNGHLFAAFAIWEASHFGYADDTLRRLHSAAVETLEEVLPLYDSGGWSTIDLQRSSSFYRLSSVMYHQLHIAQLAVYARMTGRPIFAVFARKWERGLRNLSVRAALWRYGFGLTIQQARQKLQPDFRLAWIPFALGLLEWMQGLEI